jgi:hypothetical protein
MGQDEGKEKKLAKQGDIFFLLKIGTIIFRLSQER